jgi:hypothetical protein
VNFLRATTPQHRARHEHVGLHTNQLFRKRLRAGLTTIGVTDLEGPVLTFDISEVSHPLNESIKNTLGAHLRASDQTADHGPCQSLSESRDRPCHRAAEKRDELAPLHSITSSARVRRVGGTSRPSVLAVLRLMTSSNLVG